MPDGMPPDTLTKRFFAKMYGFTEDMTDNLSVDAVMWWPVIEEAQAEAEERRMRQEQREARRNG